MDKYFVILLGICLFSGSCCIPSELNGTRESDPEAGSVTTSTVNPITVTDVSSKVSNAMGGNGSTTVTPSPDKPGTTTTNSTTIPTTTPNTTIPTSTTITTPPPTTMSTTTQPITTTTTPTTTLRPTNATSPTTEPTIPSSTTPLPTPAPSKDRRFDGPSFIGGIVLSLGIMAIAFVAFKFYKARTERNYHTL